MRLDQAVDLLGSLLCVALFLICCQPLVSDIRRQGRITSAIMLRNRPWAVVACMALAAGVTPPDPLSLVAALLPLLLFYEAMTRALARRRE